MQPDRVVHHLQIFYPHIRIRIQYHIVGTFIHHSRTTLPVAPTRSSTYCRRDREGLDRTLDLPQKVVHLAYPEQLLATFIALQGTILPLGQGSFMHNTAYSLSLHVPMQIYSMTIRPRQCRCVWGKGEANGRRREERTDGRCRYCARFAKNVRVAYLLLLFLIPMIWQTTQASSVPPHPKLLNVMHQYALHVLFVHLPPRRARQHSGPVCNDPFPVPAAGLVVTLGVSSFSLLPVERALPEIEVGLRRCASTAPTSTSPVFESTLNPMRHAAAA